MRIPPASGALKGTVLCSRSSVTGIIACVTTDCSYYTKAICRSCAYLDRPYPEQLRAKEAFLKKALKASLDTYPEPEPIVPSDPVFTSRFRAKLAIGSAEGRPIAGFPDSSGRITEVEDCPLHHPDLNRLANAALTAVTDAGITPYEVASQSGELKYLLLSLAGSSGEVMLRFVSRHSKSLSAYQRISKTLQAQFPSLTVASLNIQPEHKAVVEGKEEILLTARGYITETLAQVTLAYPPQSFSQVTPNVAEKLYQAAQTHIRSRRPASILELYCGVGAFSLFAASYCEKAVGVEISESAITHARISAALNRVENVSFEAADVVTFLQQHGAGFGMWIVNPPRRGLDRVVLDGLTAHKPDALIYSSCNASTLARDLAALSSHYALEYAQPFDMFPLTPHFETLAVLKAR